MSHTNPHGVESGVSHLTDESRVSLAVAGVSLTLAAVGWLWNCYAGRGAGAGFETFALLGTLYLTFWSMSVARRWLAGQNVITVKDDRVPSPAELDGPGRSEPRVVAPLFRARPQHQPGVAFPVRHGRAG